MARGPGGASGPSSFRCSRPPPSSCWATNFDQEVNGAGLARQLATNACVLLSTLRLSAGDGPVDGRPSGTPASVWSGLENQFVGDEVMALFGIPVARRDDPRRAVAAALELHRVVDGIAAEFSERLGKAQDRPSQ